MIEPKWLLVEFIWMGIAFLLLGAAFQAKNEWTKACVAALGLSLIAWHTLAILPSWWLYYADSVLRWGGQGCTKIDPTCLKQALKDTIVVIENGVFIGVFVVGFMLYQKRFPKQLATGEAKGEAIGGYK